MDRLVLQVLCNYLLYHDVNPRKALELAAEATAASEYGAFLRQRVLRARASFKDWWWKVRVGQCHYKLGLFREAERQFRSALRDNDTISVYLYLSKVYVRLDQPNTALELLSKAAERYVVQHLARLVC